MRGGIGGGRWSNDCPSPVNRGVNQEGYPGNFVYFLVIQGSKEIQVADFSEKI